MIKINGVEFEIDTMELDIAEQIEEELTKFAENVKKIGNTATRKDIIKATVNAASKVFNNVLGEGAAEKIFKGKKNLLLTTKCMEEFVVALDGEDIKAKDEIDKSLKKFSPNRAQRRSKVKK